MSAKRFTFDTTVGKREAEVRVTYSVTPPVAATHWQPAEGAEVEILSIRQNGKAVFLSQDEEDVLLEEARDRALQDWEDDKAAEADWRYQEYRDRILMDQWERGQ